MRADLVIKDAALYQSAASSPSHDWLVIRNGIIEAVLPEEEASRSDWDCEVLSLDGRTILPGLYDSHIHLLMYARSLEYVDCETETLKECLDRVKLKAASTAHGDWILGHGWDHNRWSRSGNRDDLDAITTRNPVFLTSKSLHSSWANSAALQLCGIDDYTPDPDGGILDRDVSGRLTGILLERASNLIEQAIPVPDHEQAVSLLSDAQKRLWRYGITGVHNFDRQDCFRALQSLHLRGMLGLHVLQSIPLEALDDAAAAGITSLLGDVWLRIGAVKLFVDGALGPHTAAMVAPYDSEPDNAGVLLIEKNDLQGILEKAEAAGFPLAVHAIGDRANRVVLDVLQTACRDQDSSVYNPSNHRIEHAQLLLEEDFPRFASTCTTASMQPLHATSDMNMAVKNWGSRCKRSYAWKSLLDAGATLLFGSDAPVESPNPFLGIHAAVTRRRADGSPGQDGWYPEQRLTLPEALHAYTAAPAQLFHSKALTGTLAPGASADLIVLDHDPLSVDPHTIKDILPSATMSGGIWRYRSF